LGEAVGAREEIKVRHLIAKEGGEASRKKLQKTVSLKKEWNEEEGKPAAMGSGKEVRAERK